MSEFNKRYDFDRAQSPMFSGDRLRSILILLAVLIVTGVIIYFIIPHGESKKGKGTETKTENSQHAAKTSNDERSQAQADQSGSADCGQGETKTAGQQAVEKTDTGNGENDVKTGTNSTWSSGNPTEGGVEDPLERAKEIVVQPGEDLGTIARRHHTTVAGIKHFNGLNDDRIRNGQKLKVIPGPWRITVQNGLILEHAPDGQWQLFKSFPADANGIKGKFVIASMHYKPIWVDADGSQFQYGDPENPYGDHLLKLANPATPRNPLRGCGIHGITDKTAGLNKNCGRGCIHVSAPNIKQLYYLVCPGTEVTVIPGEAVRKPEM